MAFTIARVDARRARFGDYRYRILRDGRLVAHYFHDFRGDEHWIEFVGGTSVRWPVGTLIEFMTGGGDALELTGGAVAFLARALGREDAPARRFLVPGASRRDPGVRRWLAAHGDALGTLARDWFGVMRAAGNDVREILHDGKPTACVGEAAFAHVAVFTAHVNVGFYNGAALPDPGGLLEGRGRFMRHVKLGPGRAVDAAALRALIERAYRHARDAGG